MLQPRLMVGMLSAATSIFTIGVAFGQDYPNKPIRIVCAQIGGGADFLARIVAPGISGSLGQPVVIENRPSVLTGGIVAKATPDGYTLLLAGTTFMNAPLLRDVPYDPLKDFSPITML